VNKRDPADNDAEVLPEPVADRLLSRASELDAIRTSGAAVSDLRAAAVEAGISAPAFDAALAELRGAEGSRVHARKQPPRRRRLRIFATVAAVLIAFGTFAFMRTTIPSDAAQVAGAPMVEETILLDCLEPGEAAALVRPILNLRTNTVVHSLSDAPRALTIRATPAQIQRVKSMLGQYADPASAACKSRPGPRTP
jgi:hypothetical protein